MSHATILIKRTLYEHQAHDIHPVSLEEHHAEQHAAMNPYQRAKTWLAIKITTGLGTMECAMIFVCLAVYGFPPDPTPQQLVQWVSQTLIQLTALSILGNGQQILGDIQEHIIREISKHVEIILHQDRENTNHLSKQDGELLMQTRRFSEQEEHLLKQDTILQRLMEKNIDMERHILALSETILQGRQGKPSFFARFKQKAGKHG